MQFVVGHSGERAACVWAVLYHRHVGVGGGDASAATSHLGFYVVCQVLRLCSGELFGFVTSGLPHHIVGGEP